MPMLTTIVSEALVLAARLATVPTTFWPLKLVLSPVPVTLSTVRPAGTASVTVTPWAVLGP